MRRIALLSKPLFSLAVFLVLGGFIAGIVWHKLRAGTTAIGWVLHTHQVLHHASQLNAALHEAESAQRGHIATGDEAFLEPYQHATGNGPGSIDTELAQLQGLVRDNEEQTQRLKQVTAMIAKKRAFMEHTIALAKKEQPSVMTMTAAQRELANGNGLRLMHLIQEDLRKFRDTETTFLNERQQRAEYYNRINAATLIFLSLLLVGVMMASFFTLRRDFLHRQRVEKTLRETTAFQRALIDGAVYAIIATDNTGIVRLFNPAAEKLTGYDAREVVGYKTPELWHDREEIAARATQLSEQLGEDIKLGFDVLVRKPNAEGSEQREWTFVRKDGRKLTVLLTVTTLHDDDGKTNGYLSIGQDITERKHIEQMKNEFISTVSHELRTPLTSIRGALGLVVGSMGDDIPANQRQLITIAHKNSERLVRLINNILDIEKIEGGHIVFENLALDIDHVIAQSIEEMQALAHKSEVQLITHHVTDGAQVLGDEDRLMQVFGNLLSNAIKYSPSGGTVNIGAERVSNVIRIYVRDEGPGIPEDFKPRIFGKFAQADSSDSRQKPGTGLGLSISKAIVESMDGTIGFESRPGHTVFSVMLPEWKGAMVPSNIPVQSRGVLIIEDDKDIAALLKLSLEQEGFTCDIAGTIASARQLLLQQDYLALTLDLALPDGDGLSLIRELRQHQATIGLPIVVISATAEQGKKKLSGEAVGILGWLPKPIDLERLRRLLASVRTGARMPEILYIEDEPDIITVISTALQNVATVDAAGTLKEARRKLKQRQFDLAILDVHLPDGSGLDLLPELASRPTPIPVVILSVAETPQEIQEKVTASLVKSVASEEKVVETIKSLIKRREE